MQSNPFLPGSRRKHFSLLILLTAYLTLFTMLSAQAQTLTVLYSTLDVRSSPALSGRSFAPVFPGTGLLLP
jgi:hypothetical protein